MERKRRRESEKERGKDAEVGDRSSEGVVMVTSHHDEVESDETRLSVTARYTRTTYTVWSHDPGVASACLEGHSKTFQAEGAPALRGSAVVTAALLERLKRRLSQDRGPTFFKFGQTINVDAEDPNLQPGR